MRQGYLRFRRSDEQNSVGLQTAAGPIQRVRMFGFSVSSLILLKKMSGLPGKFLINSAGDLLWAKFETEHLGEIESFTILKNGISLRDYIISSNPYHYIEIMGEKGLFRLSLEGLILDSQEFNDFRGGPRVKLEGVLFDSGTSIKVSRISRIEARSWETLVAGILKVQNVNGGCEYFIPRPNGERYLIVSDGLADLNEFIGNEVMIEGGENSGRVIANRITTEAALEKCGAILLRAIVAKFN